MWGIKRQDMTRSVTSGSRRPLNLNLSTQETRLCQSLAMTSVVPFLSDKLNRRRSISLPFNKQILTKNYCHLLPNCPTSSRNELFEIGHQSIGRNDSKALRTTFCSLFGCLGPSASARLVLSAVFCVRSPGHLLYRWCPLCEGQAC